MEYRPRYAQPFTLAEAIALDISVIAEEISRLRNSLEHLRRTQAELKEFIATENGDPELKDALEENEVVIGSQEERISILRMALAQKGVPTSHEHYRNDGEPEPGPADEGQDEDGEGRGIHLYEHAKSIARLVECIARNGKTTQNSVGAHPWSQANKSKMEQRHDGYLKFVGALTSAVKRELEIRKQNSRFALKDRERIKICESDINGLCRSFSTLQEANRTDLFVRDMDDVPSFSSYFDAMKEWIKCIECVKGRYTEAFTRVAEPRLPMLVGQDAEKERNGASYERLRQAATHRKQHDNQDETLALPVTASDFTAWEGAATNTDQKVELNARVHALEHQITAVEGRVRKQRVLKRILIQDAARTLARGATGSHTALENKDLPASSRQSSVEPGQIAEQHDVLRLERLRAASKRNKTILVALSKVMDEINSDFCPNNVPHPATMTRNAIHDLVDAEMYAIKNALEDELDEIWRTTRACAGQDIQQILVVGESIRGWSPHSDSVTSGDEA